MEYYVTRGAKGKAHIDTMKGKTLLCGRKPGIFWEVQYEGHPYAQVEGTSFDGSFKTNDFREGLKVLSDHQPKVYFCPKCYKKYCEINQTQQHEN